MRRIQGTHREPFFPRPPPTFSGPTRRDPCPPFPYIYIFTDRQTDGHARPYTILGTQPPPLALSLSFFPSNFSVLEEKRKRKRTKNFQFSTSASASVRVPHRSLLFFFSCQPVGLLAPRSLFPDTHALHPRLSRARPSLLLTSASLYEWAGPNFSPPSASLARLDLVLFDRVGCLIKEKAKKEMKIMKQGTLTSEVSTLLSMLRASSLCLVNYIYKTRPTGEKRGIWQELV